MRTFHLCLIRGENIVECDPVVHKILWPGSTLLWPGITYILWPFSTKILWPFDTTLIGWRRTSDAVGLEDQDDDDDYCESGFDDKDNDADKEASPLLDL